MNELLRPVNRTEEREQMNVRGVTGIAILLTAVSAYATPSLQLDIVDGTYVDGTTVTSSDMFVLDALLLPKGDMDAGSLYRVSAAVYPKLAQTEPAPHLGTFSFAGTTYNVTEDMSYGVPPATLLEDTTGIGGTLPTHGSFPTYFTEFDVLFDTTQQCAEYNVAEDVGDPGTYAGSGMYYQNYVVDLGGLAEGYGIHFDLYRVEATPVTTHGNGKKAVTTTHLTGIGPGDFAPFSHDAESGDHRNPPGETVPDASATATLFEIALCGLGILRRAMHRG
jgi:hypothetical protein